MNVVYNSTMIHISNRLGQTMVAVLCSVAVLASLAHAQPSDVPSSRGVSEQVKVTLRLIDVLATDKRGNPLTGLGPEDFTVLINGKERPISTFDAAVTVPPTVQAVESDRRSTKATKATDLPSTEPALERPGRWIVILLDADRMPHNYRKVVLKTARAMITDGGGPDDRFAVAMLRNGSLQFLQDFAPARDVDLSIFNDPGMLISRANDLRFRLDELVDLVTG